jgi:hypothetical protein
VIVISYHDDLDPVLKAGQVSLEGHQCLHHLPHNQHSNQHCNIIRSSIMIQLSRLARYLLKEHQCLHHLPHQQLSNQHCNIIGSTIMIYYCRLARYLLKDTRACTTSLISSSPISTAT